MSTCQSMRCSENALTELKTTNNLLPFAEMNPYKEPLAKAEQFTALCRKVQPEWMCR